MRVFDDEPTRREPLHDAVVALSGFVGPPVAAGYVPNLSEASERLEAGITIWQQKKAKLLVFTGGQLPWIKQSEIEEGRPRLRRFWVRASSGLAA